MAPLLFALALIMQDAPAPEAAGDAPVATAVPRKQDVAPLPIQGGPVSAPTDDYGYVGWCYGAISGYVDLYERAMPEVTRIERAWPTPSTEDNIKVVYPGQRDEAKRNLALFARAMEAAEKASPTPIQMQGAAAIKRGRAVWTGATSVPKAQLAQFWMSWSPPAKCEETAKTLETRSLLFGQALTYNAKGAAPIVAPPPPMDDEPATPVLSTPAKSSPLGDLPPVGPSSDDSATPAPGEGSVGPAPEDAPATDGPPTEESADAPPATAIDALLPDSGPATEEPAAPEPPSEDPAPAAPLKGPQ